MCCPLHRCHGQTSVQEIASVSTLDFQSRRWVQIHLLAFQSLDNFFFSTLPQCFCSWAVSFVRIESCSPESCSPCLSRG